MRRLQKFASNSIFLSLLVHGVLLLALCKCKKMVTSPHATHIHYQIELVEPSQTHPAVGAKASVPTAAPTTSATTAPISAKMSTPASAAISTIGSTIGSTPGTSAPYASAPIATSSASWNATVQGIPGNEPPRYPREARMKGEQGKVIVKVELAPEGLKKIAIEKSSGFSSLDQAVLNTLAHWTFPNSQTPAAYLLPFRFVLNAQ